MDRPGLNVAGRFMIERSLTSTAVASYRPTLTNIAEVSSGNCAADLLLDDLLTLPPDLEGNAWVCRGYVQALNSYTRPLPPTPDDNPQARPDYIDARAIEALDQLERDMLDLAAVQRSIGN